MVSGRMLLLLMVTCVHSENVTSTESIVAAMSQAGGNVVLLCKGVMVVWARRQRNFLSSLLSKQYSVVEVRRTQHSAVMYPRGFQQQVEHVTGWTDGTAHVSGSAVHGRTLSLLYQCEQVSSREMAL
jgi:hypothetical protein